ncbi:MAG: chemotaxis protein CheW [Planctomycetota bacterium]
MLNEKQFCTFRLNDMLCGVEVGRVQEVLRYQRMTRIPLAPPTARGLINLRGQIVTAIDMRTRLGFPALPEGRRPMNVVLHPEAGGVSLLVDEIGDVLEVSNECYEQVPEHGKHDHDGVIEGVYKLDGELLHVLDTERAIQIA